MTNEYQSLCRIVDSSNLTFRMIMIFLFLGTQQWYPFISLSYLNSCPILDLGCSLFCLSLALKINTWLPNTLTWSNVGIILNSLWKRVTWRFDLIGKRLIRKVTNVDCFCPNKTWRSNFKPHASNLI